MHSPFFHKKGNLGIIENYRGITLISVAAKTYNMLLNIIQPFFEKILRRNQNGFRKVRSTFACLMAILNYFLTSLLEWTRQKPRKFT